MSANPGEILSVSQLNRDAKVLLEQHFGAIWVEAEVSNLARPASGHLYFSLKDSAAQIRCAMFRTRNSTLRFAPADGMQVLVRGRVSLFEPRGDFQLIVEYMEPAGEGLLRLKFEQLRQKLAQEGLFDAGRKRPLPAWPRCGIVTSPSGAAVRDILAVLRRRCPSLPVILYPAAVQGAAAAGDIVRALAAANRRAECDVLILARGGGSLEDLWSFNEESVARAIAASRLPVVSGVGHETDVTIADFVADLRAPTPSAAAELVSPDQRAIERALIDTGAVLLRTLRARLDRLAESVDWCERRLPDPTRMLDGLRVRLMHLRQRLPLAMLSDFRRRGALLAARTGALRALHPQTRLAGLMERNRQLEHRLGLAMQRQIGTGIQRLDGLMRALQAISPLATLDRGYAIVTRAETTEIARDAAAFNAGDPVVARLAHGRLHCTVNNVDSGDPTAADGNL